MNIYSAVMTYKKGFTELLKTTSQGCVTSEIHPLLKATNSGHLSLTWRRARTASRRTAARPLRGVRRASCRPRGTRASRRRPQFPTRRRRWCESRTAWRPARCRCAAGAVDRVEDRYFLVGAAREADPCFFVD